MFLYLLSVAVLLFGFWIYNLSSKSHRYWIDRGVPQAKPTFLIGNSAWALTKNLSTPDVFRCIYRAFPGQRYGGVYQLLTPILILRDPELIKEIIVRDFDHFTDHWTEVNEKVDPIWAKSVLALKGIEWRVMRNTLSPFFTSKKMRSKFVESLEIADEYTEILKDMLKKNSEIEIREFAQRYSNDIMVYTALGVKCDSFRNRNNDLYLTTLDAFGFQTAWKNFKFFMILMVPKLATLFGLKFFSKQVKKYFTNFIHDLIKTRQERNIVRDDLIQLLMNARNGKMFKYVELEDNLRKHFASLIESDIGKSSAHSKRLSDIDITAQALIFQFAGFDTVAILMSFMVHELTINQDIQKRLQDEIDETEKACNENITYEALLNMQFMDMVVSETLRKHPPAISLDRKCVKPYTIPAKHPGETTLELQPGAQIWIPASGLHWDPKYYPNPEKFDPDRFSDENKAKILPYAYLPFGAGPRLCLGSRFALMQTKIFAYYFFKKFNAVPTERTCNPIKINKGMMLLHVEGDSWVRVEERIKN